MKWNETKQVEKDLNLGGNRADFYELEEGPNKVRVLSEYEPQAKHFTGVGTKPTPCVGVKENCSFCLKREELKKAGADATEIAKYKPSVKFLMLVIDRLAQSKGEKYVKIAQFPWSVVKQVGEFAENDEYGFETLPPYDITVTKKRTGTRPTDIEYSVVPARANTELTQEEQDEILNHVDDVKRLIASQKKKQIESSETEPPEDASEDVKVEDIPF